MPTAHPLRVSPDGKLEQQDPLAALVGIITVMAGTTSTTWPHAKWFGLFELFVEAAQRQKQDQEALKDALNDALRRLGIIGYTVHAMTTGAIDAETGIRQFELTIHDATGRAFFAQVGAP